MKQQLRAVVKLTGILAVATLVVSLVRLALTNINPMNIPYVVGSVMLGIALYTLYTIFLAQVKYEDKLKEIAKK
jgi:ABC-type Fe3+-siderophore transport system permease subunit